MKVIFKYKLEHVDEQTILLPEGSKIAIVGSSGRDGYIWVEHDPRQPKEEVKIFLYGTGHVIEEGHIYIGSYEIPSIGFIGHVYVEDAKYKM